MDESERPQGRQDLGKKGKVNAGTNTPSGKGDPSFEAIPSSDAPTMVPHSELSASDAPTLVPSSLSDTPTIVPHSELSASDAPTLVSSSLPVDAASTAAGITKSPSQRSVSTQAGLSEGTTLAGRYQILQTLGEGGMGTVYKAKDLELDRVVALKVIRPDLARDPTIIDRFKQELLLSHRVTHRNVIRIYDLGEGDGVKFITMEFIEGQDLRGMIRAQQKLSPEDAVGILIQVCHALDLSNHFKSGQRLSVQNRPTEVAVQD
jgi:eukaryotic-like serine/threonine-protein kinase